MDCKKFSDMDCNSPRVSRPDGNVYDKGKDLVDGKEMKRKK